MPIISSDSCCYYCELFQLRASLRLVCGLIFVGRRNSEGGKATFANRIKRTQRLPLPFLISSWIGGGGREGRIRGRERT